jgi:hypothetical protein
MAACVRKRKLGGLARTIARLLLVRGCGSDRRGPTHLVVLKSRSANDVRPYFCSAAYFGLDPRNAVPRLLTAGERTLDQTAVVGDDPATGSHGGLGLVGCVV